jgi:dipeptidyl aminopeptidase/acylaminoacyl peptidase
MAMTASGNEAADPAAIADDTALDQVSDEVTLPAVPFGEWPSPITAADVAKARADVSFPIVIGSEVWWEQVLADEGGRTTVMHSSGGKPTMLLPDPWNARTRVHEYGGLSYLPVPRTALRAQGLSGRGHLIVFANLADQRLYVAAPVAKNAAQSEDGPGGPRPLTPDPALVPSESGSGTLAPGALRYADFTLSPDRREIWCVRERHEDGKVSRAIVGVPLDGSAAENPEAIRTLVSGAHFFAYPTPSPDGRWLAWICWNHPQMPWDGTELQVAPVENGVPGRARPVMGGHRESVLAPLWRDNSSLYVATDWPGWWNIYQVGLSGEPPLALYPAEEEFAAPLWQLGARPFALLKDGRLAVAHGAGPMRLAILDPESFELKDLDTPFTEFAAAHGPPALSADGESIVAVAGGPSTGRTVVRIDAATAKTDVLLHDSAGLPDPAYLPVPQLVDFEGPYGQVVHALLYPPTNPEVTGPPGERPPYVVWVHGGPTSRATPTLDLVKAYFTSRGIGIINVNYGGSSGYGRQYRERLRREWGVVDVHDAIAAARWVAETAGADPARLAIRGGSAGGWTTLAAVTTGVRRGRVFSAAASFFGVADLRGFTESTHDFESRYLDGLIGPLPAFETRYEERAPVGHVSDATCPILLLQGLDDPVVPAAQSESIAADLAAHGIRHAYIGFAGESHGFRKTETLVAAYEAELSFYGQILGFDPPGIPKITIDSPAPATHTARGR